MDKKLDVKKEEKKVWKIIDNLLPLKELEKMKNIPKKNLSEFQAILS